APALHGRPHVDLLEIDDAGFLLGDRGIGHAGKAGTGVGDDEFRPRPAQHLPQPADGMPPLRDRVDAFGAVDRIVGGVPGLGEQRRDFGKVALARRADEHFYLMPSRALTSSLTACGLALPPVAFITWPTNQPAMVG